MILTSEQDYFVAQVILKVLEEIEPIAGSPEEVALHHLHERIKWYELEHHITSNR